MDMDASSPAEICPNAGQSPGVVRGYFRHRVVYPWQLPSLMRKHIYTGAMGNIWATLISGIFFVYFGTAVGVSKFEWSLMAGISSWLISAQVISAALTEWTGRRKVIWFCFAVGERTVRMAGILLALWLWSHGSSWTALVLISAICLANLCGTMSSPPWLSWLADLIPEEEHGTFYGRRASWMAVSVMAVVIPSGYLVDRIPEEHKLQAVTVVFLIATAVGLLDLVIHGTLPEPPMGGAAPSAPLIAMLGPLRDRGFRPWLLFNAMWTFSMTLGGSLATIYFVQDLEIRRNFLGGAVVLTSATLLGSIVTGRWSGRLVDRVGARQVLYWGHLVWASLPLFWVLATPASALVWLALGSVVGGTSSTAANTASNKLITRFPPAASRAMYCAVSSSLGSIAGGLGVITGGLILHLLEDWRLPVAGWVFGGFQVTFVASSALRFCSALLLIRRMPGPAAPEGPHPL
ncbi:MAG: MFS transporter [Lentisphaeria bacterium]|nr:MFS transporter [Lentisphaeria bacterium]